MDKYGSLPLNRISDTAPLAVNGHLEMERLAFHNGRAYQKHEVRVNGNMAAMAAVCKAPAQRLQPASCRSASTIRRHLIGVCATWSKPPQVVSMNTKSETERLAEAVANVATAIMEITELKLRELAEAAKAAEPVHSEINRLAPAEGWVGKNALDAHLSVSKRTVESWMKKALLPYIRSGHNVRFKLSEVDEALNRKIKVHARY